MSALVLCVFTSPAVLTKAFELAPLSEAPSAPATHAVCTSSREAGLEVELAAVQSELAAVRARYDAVVPSHSSSLQRLKQLGFTPSVIYDVGAATGGWTADCRRIFPDAVYHLWEPSRVYPNAAPAPGVIWHHELLFRTNESIEWWESTGAGDSILRERTTFYKGVQPTMRQAHRLDSLVAAEMLPLPQLLKVDTQGSEVYVLQGAIGALSECEAIIIELPLAGEYNANRPSLSVYVQLLEALGYETFDVVEVHMTDGLRLQFDLLFVRAGGSLARAAQARINALGLGSNMEQHLLERR